MKTLDDAWRWYENTRVNLLRLHRLARKYWQILPWEEALGRDDDFRLLEADDVVDETTYSLEFLDDLAIVVLFSVFEQLVRGQVSEEVRVEADDLVHPVLQKAAKDALWSIEEGSFARRLESYKPQVSVNLIEVVSQVRGYRNWITHGRRGAKPPSVTPRDAYERLSMFLDTAIASESSPD